MSLIHKALKKAEGQAADGLQHEPLDPALTVGSPSAIRPLTVVLILLIVAGLGYVGYKRFWPATAPEDEAPAVTIETIPTTESAEAEGGITGTTPGAETGTTAEARPAVPVGDASGLPVPESIAADVAAAEALFASGDYPGALAKFSAATTTEPSAALAWNNLGLTHKKMGKLAEAEQAYRKAIALEPKYPEALNNLATLRVAQGQQLEAVLLYRQAIEMEPTYADAHFNLAVLMEEEGNWRSAIEEYKAFLQHARVHDTDFLRQVEARIEEIAP